MTDNRNRWVEARRMVDASGQIRSSLAAAMAVVLVLSAIAAGVAVLATPARSTPTGADRTGTATTNETIANDTDDWEQYRGGPGHAGATDDAGPQGPYAEVRYYRRGGEPDTPPVVANGTLYIGATTNPEYTDFSGTVTAVNLTTGEVRWQRDDIGAIWRPMAVGDGRLFLRTANSNATNMGFSTEYRLLALDTQTGETVWRKNDSSQTILAEPILANGTLYGHATAHDPTTGELRWVDENVSIKAVSNGTLYGMYTPNESLDNHSAGIVAWDADDRSVEWRWFPGGPGVRDFAVVNGSVYATVGTNETAAVDASDGTERWRRPIEPPVENGSVDWISEPAVADGRVYLAAEDEGEHVGTLYAFDATDGRTAWQAQPGVGFGGPPAVSANTVYVDGGGEVVGLNASTGAERWNRTLWFGDAFYYSNLVVDDGLLVFNYGNELMPGGDDGLDWVVALESSETPSDETPIRDEVVLADRPPTVTIETDPPNAGERDLEAGTNVTLTANASDSDGDVATIEWDSDEDGEYERTGETITMQLNYCGTLEVTVRVTDDDGLTTTKSVTLSTA